MKWGVRFKLTSILTAFGFAAFAGPVAAFPVVYSGYDVGSISLAGSPNATAAAAAFDLATGPLSVIDFEAAIPAGVSLSGGVIGDASVVCATPALHCYATKSNQCVPQQWGRPHLCNSNRFTWCVLDRLAA